MKHDQNKTADSGVTTLRSKFCDGVEGSVPSPAQQEVNRECQHPRQAPVQKHESFEPFGLN